MTFPLWLKKKTITTVHKTRFSLSILQFGARGWSTTQLSGIMLQKTRVSQPLWETTLWESSVGTPRHGIAGPCGRDAFWGTPILIFKVARLVYVTKTCCYFFMTVILTGVKENLSLQFPLPICWRRLNIFSCVYCPLCCIFWEFSVLLAHVWAGLFHFFVWAFVVFEVSFVYSG